MAGMRGDGRFQQERTDKEYDEAVKLALALGYGGMKAAAEQTGIPYATLARKVSDYKKAQGIADLADPPPVPDDNITSAMADMAIEAIWHEMHRTSSPEAIQANGKADLKALSDAATALKNWMGLGKLSPHTKQKESALSSLTQSGSSGGKRAA